MWTNEYDEMDNHHPTCRCGCGELADECMGPNWQRFLAMNRFTVPDHDCDEHPDQTCEGDCVECGGPDGEHDRCCNIAMEASIDRAYELYKEMREQE